MYPIFKNHSIIFLILIVSIFILNQSAVYAANFTVNSTSDTVDQTPGDGICLDESNNCTLRAAIEEANALQGDDIISLPTLTFPLTIERRSLIVSSNIVFRVVGKGSAIIDANANNSRVFRISNNNITVEFNNLIIQNGDTSLATPFQESGGGIQITGQDNNITFNNCVIRNNKSISFGGGISNSSSTLRLNNTQVINNTADATFPGIEKNEALGGGIINSGTLIIHNSTISNNRAISGDRRVARGGGIENFSGDTTITDSTISGNSAYNFGDTLSVGGGISSIFGSSLNIINSSVSNNKSDSFFGVRGNIAGGILNSQSTLNIESSIIANNVAGAYSGILTASVNSKATTTISRSAVINNTSRTSDGGGVINISEGSSQTITNIYNSTIGQNTASGDGAGILNLVESSGDAIINIDFSTIAKNSADFENLGNGFGGGIANLSKGGTGNNTVNISNSIVADNTAGDSDSDISGVITSGDYNHLENIDNGIFIPMSSDVTGEDPELNSLILNGGTTPNFLPSLSSPVIDTIPNGNNGCGIDSNQFDQRGFTRPTDTNGDMLFSCEKGAIEVRATSGETVSISGRITNNRGRGIVNATIKISNQNGTSYYARSNVFGYYRFRNIQTGITYSVEIYSKQYEFDNFSVLIKEETNSLNFTPRN